jgi:hypothetical protein
MTDIATRIDRMCDMLYFTVVVQDLYRDGDRHALAAGYLNRAACLIAASTRHSLLRHELQEAPVTAEQAEAEQNDPAAHVFKPPQRTISPDADVIRRYLAQALADAEQAVTVARAELAAYCVEIAELRPDIMA